jgi:hypothetical protein
MKAIKPTVLILTLSGTISKEKLKPVEAFLFKADSITVFLDVVKTLLNTCRPTLNACAIPDRSNQKSEEAMDEFGAAAQARAACESFASDQRRSLFIPPSLRLGREFVVGERPAERCLCLNCAFGPSSLHVLYSGLNRSKF